MHINGIVSDFDFSGAENDAVVQVQIKGRDFPLEDLRSLSTSQVNTNTRQSMCGPDPENRSYASNRLALVTAGPWATCGLVSERMGGANG